MGLLGALRMQVFPLLCPRCGEAMTLIGLITERGSFQRVLEPHPTTTIASARVVHPTKTSINTKSMRSPRATRCPSMSSISGAAGLVGAAFTSPRSCRSLHVDRHRRISRSGTGYRPQRPLQPTGTAPTERICPCRGPLQTAQSPARPVRRNSTRVAKPRWMSYPFIFLYV